MAERHERAKVNLMIISERNDALMDGLKQQLIDAKDIGAAALGGNYTAQQWAQDVTALWINGAALAGWVWGLPFPAPATDGDDSE